MQHEKRQAERVKTALVVQYILGKENNKWDTTAVRDISEGGVSITTMNAFQPGEVLSLIIKTPINPLRKIEVSGRVVESLQLKTLLGSSVSGTYMTRVAFLELKEEDRQLIRDYVKWFLKKDGGSK